MDPGVDCLYQSACFAYFAHVAQFAYFEYFADFAYFEYFTYFAYFAFVQLVNPLFFLRQPIAVSDISIYISLIDIIKKQIQRTTE